MKKRVDINCATNRVDIYRKCTRKIPKCPHDFLCYEQKYWTVIVRTSIMNGRFFRLEKCPGVEGVKNLKNRNVRGH